MREVFLKTFDYLSQKLNNYRPLKNTLAILDITNQLIEPTFYWSLNIVDIENEIKQLSNISNIINKIIIGETTYFQEIPSIKNFLKNILNKFKYEHKDRRGWRYMCPEMYGSVYEIEEDIMSLLEDLLVLITMSPFELFEIMTLSEKISLKNVCLELNLPYDIQRYVSEFIGF